MDLYPYQVRVAQRLRNGTSVLLQAPTGAGKTLAALWPFLEAWDRDDPEAFPRQAIYTVPMRVLANQFLAETHRLIRRLVTPVLPQVTIQTGEQPLDPEFRGDLVFATLDQTLSSLLGVPYSLSTSRSNLNAGAVLGSYLIFDEFHLFPYEATLTVLQLLRHIGRIAPFVLMTATFSSTLLQRVADLLRASGVNVETLVVSPEEARAIATRDHRPPKERRFYVEDAPLVDPLNETHQAHSILDRHNRRSLVVLNTVGRAQTLYEALLAAGARGVPFSSLVTREEYESALQASLHIKKQEKDPQNPWTPLIERVREYLLEHADVPWVMLLHSRFEAKHRRFKEELLRALWGPKGLQAEQPSLIVVATQVVEVGLDISAEVLHTESAPAAAVLQRAGRCARYPGEKGQVYVYPVPLQANGAPNYKPYDQTAIERETCERSWAVFCGYHGQVVDFPQEQAIIDEAHTPQDEALLEDLEIRKEREIWGGVCDALALGITATRAQLIRNTISSRTLIVYDAPDESEESPFGREGFSLHVGTLHTLLPTLSELRERLGLDWALRRLEVRGGEEDDEVLYCWLSVNSAKDLEGAFFLAVHPQLATYDAERGFLLGVTSDGAYESPIAFRVPRKRNDYGAYRLECYYEHVAGMVRVLKSGPWEKRFAWPACRLAEVLEISKEEVWRLLYLTLALHDVGKLQREWQKWVWTYHQRIGKPLPGDHCLVAHAYSDGSQEKKRIAQTVRPKRPPHAAEGAIASWPILYRALDGGQGDGWLARIACTAIARHHSARTSNAKPFRMHPRAHEAVRKALEAIREWGEGVDGVLLRLEHAAPRLEDYLIDLPDERASDEVWWDWWTYLLLVRTLRLTDGLSQEQGAIQ